MTITSLKIATVNVVLALSVNARNYCCIKVNDKEKSTFHVCGCCSDACLLLHVQNGFLFGLYGSVEELNGTVSDLIHVLGCPKGVVLGDPL